MIRPFPVCLQLLLVVAQMGFGATDVSPFQPEAKGFHCCNNDTMDLWDPKCPDGKQLKCASGQACWLVFKHVDFAPVRFNIAARCYKDPKDPTMNCTLDGTNGADCLCGYNDTFEQCNPLGYLQQLKLPFCPVPPGSEPKCVENSNDPYCHYGAIQDGTDFQFYLQSTSCRSSKTYRTAKHPLDTADLPTVCNRSEKKNGFDCKCFGVNCVKPNLVKMLRQLISVTTITATTSTTTISTSSVPTTTITISTTPETTSSSIDTTKSSIMTPSTVDIVTTKMSSLSIAKETNAGETASTPTSTTSDRPVITFTTEKSLGTKLVSALDPEAKDYSCCTADQIDLWNLTCPLDKLIKCPNGQSCQLRLQISDDQKFLNISKSAAHYCVDQKDLSLNCTQENLISTTCICGIQDSFQMQCNPPGFDRPLRKFATPYCPIPPGSNPKCLDADGPDDPYCRYKVTKKNSGEFQFELRGQFCRGTNRSEQAKIQVQNGLWPPDCQYTIESQDGFDCICVGFNCGRPALMAIINNQIERANEAATTTLTTTTPPKCRKVYRLPSSTPTTTRMPTTPTTDLPISHGCPPKWPEKLFIRLITSILAIVSLLLIFSLSAIISLPN